MLTIHITRHGQPGQVSEDQSGDPEYSEDDPGLSSLGMKQAEMLGQRLSAENFRGTVYSSPYRRTFETASIFAAVTGSDLFPEPLLQEHLLNPGRPDFRSLTLDEIRKTYANVPATAELECPWLVEGPEDLGATVNRLERFVETMLQQYSEGEFLFVGHGATVISGINLFIPKADRDAYLEDLPHYWNCCLSTYTVNRDWTTGVGQVGDTSHMPDELVTSNGHRKLDRPTS